MQINQTARQEQSIMIRVGKNIINNTCINKDMLNKQDTKAIVKTIELRLKSLTAALFNLFAKYGCISIPKC